MHAEGESRVDSNLARSQCPLWVKSGHQRMSTGCLLYPAKADIDDAMRNVRFVPKADITSGLIDYFIGAAE